MVSLPFPQGQENSLLRAYAARPSVALRNRIVQRNASLVRQIACRFSRTCTEPYEDLVQVGFLGLIRAVERFDPRLGAAFGSFAGAYIRGEILHYLRDCGHLVQIPRRWQDLQAAARNLQRQLAERLGHQPTDTEVAQALHIAPIEWQTIQWAMRNQSPLSLDAPVQSSLDESLTLAEILPDPRADLAQGQAEDWLVIQTALSALEHETRTVLEGVFLEKRTRRDLARHLGVSPMTITRRLQRALQTLGSQFAREDRQVSGLTGIQAKAGMARQPSR
jgi:RNA polymerase sigma-B factor